MYNLQPGQGLGGPTSRLLAYGLGSTIQIEPPPEDVPAGTIGGGGGKEYVSRYEWDDILGDIERRARIVEDDDEVLEIIIEAILAGVIE